MKKLSRIFLIFLLVCLTPLLLLIGGSLQKTVVYGDGSAMYAEHWSTGDPYTHDLLVQRYGIKAEQLDGYLDSTGIPYDKNRINGKKLLQWQSASGLDVRAIIAIAIHESSLGTAGVATVPGANMFGFGAFDSNPENASAYNDEVAVVQLTKQTIIAHKNQTFKIQDEKARKNAEGTLRPEDGGVYFTDTSGSGRRRADEMAKIDKWIDEHGGTPKPPAGSARSPISGDFAHIFNVPYTVVQPYGKTPWSQGGGAWMYPMGRHSGVDLQGQGFESGDVSVFSATDGKLYTISADPMGGYYIVIEPPFGGYIYYGHMKAAEPIPQGASIKKGQKIGVMGIGGGVYHVHFEYNKDISTIGSANSQDQDPSFLVQKEGTLQQNQVITP